MSLHIPKGFVRTINKSILMLVAIMMLTPTLANALSGPQVKIFQEGIHYFNVDTGSCAVSSVTTTLGSSSDLGGHKLPATIGGTGDEDPVDATGHLTTTGGAVTFPQFASLGQAYRDYYITMRWRYALWNWDGTST